MGGHKPKPRFNLVAVANKDLSEITPGDMAEVMDHVSTENKLYEALRGCPFWSNAKFIEFLRELPDATPEDVLRKLLAESRSRLERAKVAEPVFHIVTLRQVSIRQPSEWEGELQEGTPFFIRYAHGKLCTYVDDHLVDFYDVDGISPDEIEYERIRVLLQNQFTFPPAEKIMLKPIPKPGSRGV